MTEASSSCKTCGTTLLVNDGKKLPNVQISIQEINITTVAECLCENEKSKNPIEPTEDCGTPTRVKSIKSIQWEHPVPAIRDDHDADHDAEHDINGCLLWGNNWRQFTSVLPGISLLLAVAVQNAFVNTELNQLNIVLSDSNDSNDYDDGTNTRSIFSNQMILLLLWNGGSIFGCLCAAVLVRKLRKRSIYVS